MGADGRGLPLSTADAAAVEAIDRFTIDFLAARAGAVAILPFAEERPDCAIAQVYAALLVVYLQSTTTTESMARPLLARAGAGRPPMHAREHALAAAVAAACDGDYARAATHCEAIVASWPRDLVAVKFAEFMWYFAPDPVRHRRFMDGIAAANAGDSHFEAMHAFALQLDGDDAAAERVGESAIAHDPDTPWAHHALAHIHLKQGRLDEGLARLTRYAPSWDGHARSMQCHNWWHVALFRLAENDRAGALADYRARLWGFDASDPQEHVDAISLLWRLELAGGSADAEWSAIAPHVGARAAEHVFPFLNAHYLYALARAGDAAAVRTAIAALHAFAARQEGEAARVWRQVGVPLLQGCTAFAQGDATRAATLLAPIVEQVACVGGSDAQNDLFPQTYLVALIRAGRHAEARAQLARRAAGRHALPLEQAWLAEAGG